MKQKNLNCSFFFLLKTRVKRIMNETEKPKHFCCVFFFKFKGIHQHCGLVLYVFGLLVFHVVLLCSSQTKKIDYQRRKIIGDYSNWGNISKVLHFLFFAAQVTSGLQVGFCLGKCWKKVFFSLSKLTQK